MCLVWEFELKHDVDALLQKQFIAIDSNTSDILAKKAIQGKDKLYIEANQSTLL